MGILQDDIDFVLADLRELGAGVRVTFGGVTVDAIKDVGPGLQTDETGLTIELDDLSLLVRTGAWSPLPTVDQQLTIAGATYRVRQVKPEPRDGELTRLVIAKV